MADPIGDKRVSAVQTLSGAAQKAATTVADSTGQVARDSLLMKGLGPIKWQPAAPQDDYKGTFRKLSDPTLASIAKMVGNIFAPPPAESGTAKATEAPPSTTVFDPSNANTNGDGSLEPPAGIPRAGEPAPGKGAVTPPGLAGGNTVFRYGANGDPANFQILDQGDTNGCGTTSLAMMLDFFAGGQPVFDREKVDARIRHYNMFTSPGDIAAFAEHQGLEAAIHTDTTPADLKRMIDQGLPVQVLMDVSDPHDGSGLHYEVVTGYGKGPDGKTYYELANPWGKREYMAEDAFMKRWSDITVKGYHVPLNRTAIVMKPQGSPAQLLSDDRGDWLNTKMATLRTAQGLTEITSGWARHDASTIAAGLIRLVPGGVLGTVPAAIGWTIRRAGGHLIADGRKDLGHGVGGTLLGLGKLIAGSVGELAGGTLEAFGDITNRAFDLVASGVQSTGHAIGRLFSKLF